MAKSLPGTKNNWEKEVKNRKITVGLLASGQAFKSGSNFSEGDYLRLRILHRRSDSRDLYHSEISKSPLLKSSLITINQAFDHSPEIQSLRRLLSDRTSLNSWASLGTRSGTQFGVALAFLFTITASPSVEGSFDDTVSSRIINSPRVRRVPERYGQANTDLVEGMS